MAVTCPIDFDVASLRVEVQTMYSRVATSPNGEFHFHRGPQYAATMLGYDSTELAVLPPDVTSSFGVDMTEAMRQRATAGAAACGLDNVEVRNGDATRLPIDDRSVDVVISNGVLNLVPEKERAVAEIARVLKPGGRVQIADIIIGEVLPDSALRVIDLWTG